jgi:mono/diheme cytochrome c family protein
MNRKRTLYTILFLSIAMVVGVSLTLWWLISRGFSAKDEPSPAEAFIARHIRRLAVPSDAQRARNPIESSPEVLSAAMEHWADHCAICHANDGSGRTLIGRGLYPKPPDMALQTTQDLTDGELYYVIENGIRFTGMPAFGEQPGNPDDKETWELVDFIRHLPKISDDEVVRMNSLNPKSPGELAKEEKVRRFLEGGVEESASDASHNHHHYMPTF